MSAYKRLRDALKVKSGMSEVSARKFAKPPVGGAAPMEVSGPTDVAGTPEALNPSGELPIPKSGAVNVMRAAAKPKSSNLQSFMKRGY